MISDISLWLQGCDQYDTLGAIKQELALCLYLAVVAPFCTLCVFEFVHNARRSLLNSR